MATTPKQQRMNSSHNARAPGGEPEKNDASAVPGAEDEQSAAPNEPSQAADPVGQTQAQIPADRDPMPGMNEDIDEEDEEEESPTKAL